MAFAEDLTAFLSDDEFSVPATLPGGSVVQVIFDDPHSDVLGSGMLEDSAPQALGRSVDLDTVSHGAAIAVAGRNWRVAARQPDGTGMTRLLLERMP